MPAEKSPAFQFYIRDWRSSRKVQEMSFKERGMYLEMLIEQWDKGAVPASPQGCAAALGGTEIDWQRSWAVLAACFSPRKRDGGLVNAKLEAIRRSKRKYLKAQSDNGLAGAEKRWQRHRTAKGSPQTGMAIDSSASAIATATATADLKNPPTPFQGARLRILRADRQEAKRMLKAVGRCTHQPPHVGTADCLAEIAAALAERRRDAEARAVAS